MMTRGELARSSSVKYLPSTRGMPIVGKKSPYVVVNSASLNFHEATDSPSRVYADPPVSPVAGTKFDMLAAVTPGLLKSRLTTEWWKACADVFVEYCATGN